VGHGLRPVAVGDKEMMEQLPPSEARACGLPVPVLIYLYLYIMLVFISVSISIQYLYLCTYMY